MMLNMFVCMHYGLLLLMSLWTTLSGVDAALPRYCGRRGSGVDALGAPAGDLDLVQIQVVTRHGARTPTGDCARWLPGARARWDCRGAVLEGATVGGAATDLRLARSFASVDGALPGTCELGQLLDEGYAQHAALGAALRDAYVGGRVGALPAGPATARSTDLSRTRQSAVALLDAFFRGTGRAPPEALETTDFASDDAYPNVLECPRLADLERRAYASDAFAAWNATADRRDLDARLGSKLGAGFSYGLDMAGGHLLDCVYASVCDGAAPGPLSPEDVADLGAQADARESFKLEHEGRAYARLAAQPLLGRLRRGLGGGASFALHSAHDTSVMPLLASLGAGDGKWAPYASAVVVERWTSRASGEGFVRVAYDGAPVVVDGCGGGELCALAEFDAATAWADEDRACGAARAPTMVVDTGRARPAALLWNAACFLAGAAAVHVVARARRGKELP